MTTDLPRIDRVVARAVDVPLEYPVRTATGFIGTAPLVLIDVTTSAGVIGRAYVFAYTPSVVRPLRDLVASLGAIVAGEAAAPLEIDRLLAGRLRLLGRAGLVAMACGGLDMALWDAQAQALGLPLAALLGGVPRDIPAYDSQGLDGVEIGRRRAAWAASQGYRAIKTKLGYPSLEEDLAVVQALRHAAGEGVALMVDYNQGLSVPEAARRMAALRDEGVAWVEEPTVQEDLGGHARLRAAAGVPVQLGENWCSPEEMQRALQAGACDLAMPDAMKIGGVTGWLRAAALAQAHGVPMSSHLFPEISVHLLSVTPTAHWLERMDFAAPVLRRPLEVVQGMARCPQGPGTGLEWNEDAVGRFLLG